MSMVPFERNSSATIQNRGIVQGLVDLGCDVDILTLQPVSSSATYDDSMADIGELAGNKFYFALDKRYSLVMSKKLHGDQTALRTTSFRGLLRTTRRVAKKTYDSVSVFDAQKINVAKVDDLEVDYSPYDIIISASYPASSHLIARRIFQKNRHVRAKWIQYWGDPFFHDMTRRNHLLDRAVRWNERRLISEADRVVYASPLALNLHKETFPEYASKMDYAIHVFPGNIPVYKNEKQSESLCVGYFGAYTSQVRNIMPTYRAAQGEDFTLIICGDSDLALDNTENITVMDRVPYEHVVKLEQQTDIILCICNVSGIQIPGKIFYYAGYQKPIIVVLDGDYKEELRKLLGTFNRYIFCENNEGDIKAAIKEAKACLNHRFVLPCELTPRSMAKRILGECLV